MNLRRILPALALLCTSHAALAQDWQFYLSENIPPAGGNTTAHVWIPPNADRVRGILWAWRVLAEEEFVLDPAIRRAAMLERLAIVYFPTLPQFGFLQSASDATQFNATMTRLAGLTGYPEFQYAPVIPFGHSTAGLLVRNQLLLMPERVAAAILFKSGNLRNTSNAWPAGAVENYADVPVLAINGEFEEFGPTGTMYPDGDGAQWLAVQADLHGLRALGYKVGQILDPGAGHYAWPNHRTFDDPLKFIPNYTALFLRKAMQRRVPAGQIATAGFLTLNSIPQASTWLTDGNCTAVVHGAHAFANFPGSTSTAFCHVDEELARAWVRNNAGQFGKPRPHLNIPGLQKHSTDPNYAFSASFGGNMSTGNRMDSTRNFFTFSGTVQVSSSNATATGQTLKFDRNSGSIGDPDPLNGRRIKVLATRTDNDMYLVAFCDANASYHYRELTLKLRRSQLTNPYFNPTGSAQSVPALLPNAAAWTGTDTPFVFNATATTSALAVDYAVEYGPAVIRNGSQVHVTGIPIGSNATSYKVRVVAAQRGSHPSWAPATQLSSIYTLNGTFPANAPIRPEPFELLVTTNGTVAVDLRWPSMLGAQYQIQQSTTLAPNGWSASGAPIDGTGSPIEASAPSGGDRGFFRVQAGGDPY